MRKTKREFREFLNSKYGGPDATDRNMKGRRGRLGATKRKYGDYLYSADRDSFNLAYERWVKTGCDEDGGNTE